MKPEGHGVIFIALRESRQSIIMYPTKLFFPKIKKKIAGAYYKEICIL